jgi:membrane fusion protein (multidrug efflux system)
METALPETSQANIKVQRPANATPAIATPVIETLRATKRKFGQIRLALIAVAAVLVVLLGARFVYRMLTSESTDDAFVVAHVHAITPEVQGMVTEVLVQEGQLVKKGDPLVKLDPRDYQAQFRIAQAKLSKASKDIGRMVRGHRADDEEDGYAPDEVRIVDEFTANALQARAELQRASLRLEHTVIVAPESGRVGKKSIETGMQVQPGQALMAVVEPMPWIVANFKETQLSKIRVGQKVTVAIDAVPEHEFEGTVDSVFAASGATFSLLPPDNATGNFTKIVQRVPVRILFDPESLKGYENRIAAGMSSEVTVRVR